MIWRGSQLMLPPVLLVLLASGSGLSVVPEELHAVVGQTLSVWCQYKPQTGPYVRKSWCRQTEVERCTRVVTTSQPRTIVEEPRHTIWDDPHAGLFVISTTDLREDDSGPYWCGKYNTSTNTIFVLRNVTLVVSPAQSTAHTWTTA
ncbi:trem-like transcript 4 protein [Fukomys damarensis]|uniref:trem-like transcript 4 protein n=1 Tax=Fukomys damarensis TaxID=885580 RepID=UPI0008FEF5CE|nr:trem-like transcript 4 protein [Fukomys damarensis]XP_019064022.1 trem-like transcript 4 protein [Fukomys damarensis]XP_033622325.1 trem-like transcript 4 protein [Fukomys damarensis]